MDYLHLLLGAFFFSVSFARFSPAAPTTVIIIRHAEKDTGANPSITQAGLQRAEQIPSKFKQLKPDEIYSSPYLRCIQTATPWAKQAGVEVKKYDPKNLFELSDYIKKSAGKTIVVVGHSNTNPQLVNLLIGDDSYNSLPDTDYETMYQVTIKNNSTKVKVLRFDEMNN